MLIQNWNFLEIFRILFTLFYFPHNIEDVLKIEILAQKGFPEFQLEIRHWISH